MNPLNLLFFFLAAVAALLLTPLFIRQAPRLGLLDQPGHRKIHRRPVPKTGGLALAVSIPAAIAAGLLAAGPGLDLTADRQAKAALVLGCALLAGLVGLFDDLFDLRPRAKLALQAALFTAFALAGYHFGVMHIPGIKTFELGALGYALTVLWMTAVVNGFNFIDGVDGLAGSVALVCLAGMGAAGFALNGPDFTGFLWVSAVGAVAVFLAFNWKPARVYLGDTGSSFLGTLLAAALVSMGQGQPGFQALPGAAGHAEPIRFQFLAATLMAGYPLLEVVLSTLRRLNKWLIYGRSMEWSEQEHLHHRLLKQGLSMGAICGLAMLFQAILTLAAVLAMTRENALATWLLVPLLMLLAYLGPHTGLLDLLRLKKAPSRPHYQIAHHFIDMQRVKLRLTRSREEVLALASQACRELGVRCFRIKIQPDGKGLGGLTYQCHDEEKLGAKAEAIPPPGEAGGPEEGFYDFCEVPGGKAEAFWVFDSHLTHDELDMEYRVLMNGFMREAVDHLVRLGLGRKTLDFPGVTLLPHHRTSGHHLRRRHHDARLN